MSSVSYHDSAENLKVNVQNEVENKNSSYRKAVPSARLDSDTH